ncbi:MAG: GGDEF domain-containing protein [Anaerolineales bacterium]
MTNPVSIRPRFAWSEWLYDLLITALWALLAGMPLFVLQNMTLLYEHYLSGMATSFSLPMALSDAIQFHPISLSLWLLAIFITVLAIRRAFRRQTQMLVIQDSLARSRTQALTDGLTGVWNRRGFDQLIQAELERAKHCKQPFSVIMADVDGLKQYNDTKGHLAADDGLRAIAQSLATQMRSADAVARFGGDEFAIVCSGLGQEGVNALIPRLKAALASAPLSLSLGSATYPLDGEDKSGSA